MENNKSQDNRLQRGARDGPTQSLNSNNQQPSIQPSQRRSKQRYQHPQQSDVNNSYLVMTPDSQSRRPLKESSSQAALCSSTKSKVPRLNLNLASPPHHQASEKKKSSRRTIHQSMEILQQPSSQGEISGAAQMPSSPKQLNSMMHDPTKMISPASNNYKRRAPASSVAQLYQPQYLVQKTTATKSQTPGENQVQFTPVRQSKGQPIQSKQLITSQGVHPLSSNVDLSSIAMINQTGQFVTIADQEDSYRIQKKSAHTQDRINNGNPSFLNEKEETDYGEMMEFDDGPLSSNSGHPQHGAIPDESYGGDYRDKDDILNDSNLSSQNNISQNTENQCEIVSITASMPGSYSKQNQNSSQRIPREDRKRRRIQQAAMAAVVEDEEPLAKSTASTQLKTLLEETSRAASKKIEKIVNERKKGTKRRSCSRSSKKGGGSDFSQRQQRQGQAAVMQQASDEGTPRGGGTAIMNRKASNSHYSTSSMYPKFDIDLSTRTPDADNINTVIKVQQQPNIDEQDVRVNNFAAQSIEIKSGQNRSNMSNSRVSLSITRRNTKDGGASETLNKLVQNSVNNLSHILRRPSTSQSRFLGENSCEGGKDSQQQFRQDSYRGSKGPSAPEVIVNNWATTVEEEHSGASSARRTTKTRSYTSSIVLDKAPNQRQRNEQTDIYQSIMQARITPEPQPEMLGERPEEDLTAPLTPTERHGTRQSSIPKPKWNTSTAPVAVAPSEKMISLRRSPRPAVVKVVISNMQKQPIKDLSIIAENGATDQNMQSSEAKKTYLQLTATAALRKEAITGTAKQRQQLRETQKRQQPKSVTNPNRMSARKRSLTSTPTQVQDQTPEKILGGDSSPEKVSAIVIVVTKLQRAMRNHFCWKRLHRLAMLRKRLAGVVLGYRVRKFFAKPSVKAQTKEIHLMIRREARQTSSYLKEQQRKKIKVCIVQLIAASCNPGSRPGPGPATFSVTPPLKQTSAQLSKPAGSSQTNTLFKKHAPYATTVDNHQTPKSNLKRNAQTPLQGQNTISQGGSATKVQQQPQSQKQLNLVRTQSARQGSRDREGKMAQSNVQHETAPSRNNARPEYTSTLRKATKSYQMKISQQVAQNANLQSSIIQQQAQAKVQSSQSSQLVQSQTAVVQSSSQRTGRGMQESHSQSRLKPTAQSHRQQKSQHRPTQNQAMTPSGVTPSTVLRNLAHTESVLSPKGAIGLRGGPLAKQQQIEGVPSTLKKQSSGSKTTKALQTKDQKPLVSKMDSLVEQETLSAIYLRGRDQNPNGERKHLQQTGHSKSALLKEKSRSRYAKSPISNRPPSDSLLKQVQDGIRNQHNSTSGKKEKAMKYQPLSSTSQGSSAAQGGAIAAPPAMKKQTSNPIGASSRPQKKVQVVTASLDASYDELRTTPKHSSTLSQTSKTYQQRSRQTTNIKPVKGEVPLSLLDLEISNPHQTMGKPAASTHQLYSTMQTGGGGGGGVTTKQTTKSNSNSLSDKNTAAKTSNQATNKSSSKQAEMKQKSATTSTKFKASEQIRDLFQEMDAHTEKVRKSTKSSSAQKNNKVVQVKQQGELLDYQGQKRLQLERLIIDLRRDFEMLCLEQKIEVQQDGGNNF